MLGLPSFIAERDWGAIAVWDPPTGVIGELERRLPREFSETLARAVLDDPTPQVAAADYYRQYAGFIRRDSTRGVLVHGMYRPVIDYIDSTTRARQAQGHRAYFPDWRTTYVGGADGGVQIFYAVYSVERPIL